ncbi:MAG: DegT/DnrJ/EryC1/StrS family aminotransferase [Deltaproteobacteria bacterium]
MKETLTWKIPLADPGFGPEEIAAAVAVLESGWVSQGPTVQRFEAAFAEYLGVKCAVAVANGTAALHLAGLALGLGPGDEVLCPALTFVATANAIRYTGAQPCFVDIAGPQDLNLAVEDMVRKISPRTKAIMVVHYGGFAADMAAILEVAQQHGLAVIEDCAHAPGAWYQDGAPPGRVGTAGILSCFSFFANKNLATGEGGMVATNDPELAESVRVARSHGMTTLTWDRHQGHSHTYDVVAMGYNYRLDEVRAAIGMVQLGRLEENNARRRELTRLYRARLTELSQVEVPFLAENLDACACHLLPILLSKGEDRSDFMTFLRERGIQTSIHYPPIHHFSYYRRLQDNVVNYQLPQTEAVAAREVTLPLFPSLTAEQVAQVTATVQDYFKGIPAAYAYQSR